MTAIANSKQVITSLLTEHFRYTPLTLIDDVINTVNELVYRAVTAVEEGLTNAPAESLGFADRAIAEGRTAEYDEDGSALYPESRPEIEHGVHQLETLLESTVDKNFDKLEIFVLRSILSVPEDLAPWIRLSHYESLEANSSTDQVTPQSIHMLRRKVYESRKLNAALVSEHARNTAMINQLKALLRQSSSGKGKNPGSLSFISSTSAIKSLSVSGSKNEDKGSLKTHTQSLISQIPALRELIETLRPKADGMEPLRTIATVEERRVYIEGQTRRQLERAGVNVQTGDRLLGGRGLGRRIWPDEINGIEAIADLLQKTKPVNSDSPDAMEE